MSDSIQAEWVKLAVSGRKQPYYDGIPAYIPVAQNANTKIYAFRRAIDGPIPDHLEPCSDYEVDKLEKRR